MPEPGEHCTQSGRHGCGRCAVVPDGGSSRGVREPSLSGDALQFAPVLGDQCAADFWVQHGYSYDLGRSERVSRDGRGMSDRMVAEHRARGTSARRRRMRCHAGGRHVTAADAEGEDNEQRAEHGQRETQTKAAGHTVPDGCGDGGCSGHGIYGGAGRVLAVYAFERISSLRWPLGEPGACGAVTATSARGTPPTVCIRQDVAAVPEQIASSSPSGHSRRCAAWRLATTSASRPMPVVAPIGDLPTLANDQSGPITRAAARSHAERYVGRLRLPIRHAP